MPNPAPTLPDLPDHIWLTILGYIDDSFLLSRLHYSDTIPTVIRRVAGDFQLWKSVRVVNPFNRGRLRKIVSFLGRHTRHITVSADKLPKDRDGFLLESFFTSVRGRCTNLKTLYLKRLHIDANLRLASNLPKSLEVLGLHDVNWTNLPHIRAITSSPFYNIRDRLPNLKRIEILMIRCPPWIKIPDINLLKKSGIDFVHEW